MTNDLIPRISIIIVTWNSYQFLSSLLQSLQNQTFQDFRVFIIDNGSTDESLSYLRNNYPQIAILENRKNLGFCRAYNQGIKITKNEFVLCLNQDIILSENFLEKLMKVAEKDQRIGSLGGKLLRFKNPEEELKDKNSSDIIDSTGILAFKTRRFINQGEGEIDKGQYNRQEEVFGISGAAVLYRRSALEDVKIADEYFDEDFFAYKEDIDLAWRLRLAGWKVIYVPEAIAYHKRGGARKLGLGDLDTIKNRRNKPSLVNYLSYKNHLFLIFKNESWFNFWWFPLILGYEIKKFIYIVFFEFSTLKALVQFFQQLPRILRKRKIVKAKRRVSLREIRKWFN